MKSLFLVFLAISAITAKSLEGNANDNDIDFAQAQPLCEPGKRFKLDDYAKCICNADGLAYTCTSMHVKETRSDGFFKISANTGYNVDPQEQVYCEPCNCNCNCHRP